ncbi:glycosyltransferase family 4 protein [Phormidesmis priestleyi]
MKLCIVTHNVIKGDGQGRVNYEIVQEAIRRGYEVTLVAIRVSPDLLQHPKIHWVEIVANGLPTILGKSLMFSRKSTAWLRQHRTEFDLIKVNGALTAADSDVNAVHFVHSSWLRSPAHVSRNRRDHYGAYQWLYTWLNAHWEKQAFRRSKEVVAVSQKVKQELIELGVPQERVQVILNGVDVQEFSPGVGDRTKWNLPEAVPMALFVGDIRSTRKNLDTVLNALVEVPALHLAVVGAVEGSPYPALTAQLGLSDRVHFLGYQRAIADIMHTADFFVLPSRYEACTLVLLEALASGLPVITTKTAGGSEIVTPDCGIVLANSETVKDLAEALHRMTANSDQRKHMGVAARTIAEQHTWSRTAASYLTLFNQMVQPS